MISYLIALILGLVEGLTEFLPISSTAHLLVTEKLLNVQSSHFVNFYTIFIQIGAILAVPVLYFKRLITSIRIYYFIIYSFIPAAIFGILLDDLLESFFEGYWYIALSWFLGGIILLKIDSWLKPKNEYVDLEESLNLLKAIKIGLYQCLAMIPGVSRSGATIVGARLEGLSHKNAVEFSFLLAMPTILAASCKKLLDYKNEIPSFMQIEQLISLSIGFLISFFVALFTIRFMVNFVSKKGFKFFGYYRIFTAILLTIYLIWNK